MGTTRKRESMSDFNPMVKVQAMRERIGGKGPWSGETRHVEKAGSGDNLLKNHSFASLNEWMPVGEDTLEFFLSVLFAGHHAPGQNAVLMRSLLTENTQRGLTQNTNRLPAGQYTFSAYVMPYTNIAGSSESPGVYLAVMDREGNVLCKSRRVKLALDRYARLFCSFCLNETQPVQVGIWISGMGTVFVNAPQLEQGSSAGKYNLLVNGTFANREMGWHILNGGAVPCVGIDRTYALTLHGGEKSAFAVQNVQERLDKHERAVYTLSGWVKKQVNGLEEEVFPQLFARICYGDGTYEMHGTSFAEDTEQWQYSAVQFFKSRSKDMQSMEIYCWQEGQQRAYFNKLRLVRDHYNSGLTADEFV